MESKNNHLVRHYAFYHRYDTDAEREVPEPAVGPGHVQVNSPRPPPRSPTGGAPTRLANANACTPPRIPLDRLLDTDVLTGTQKQELIAYRNR
ncbi:hypothetical protein [Actinomyces israelii]|uniref:hypothetical protein n=1 Tax=Actinomyces israelii TaxID=1659 RepID=UPI001E6587D9|nr:hypothetical protein [Actinomyces israelii]